MVEDEKLTVREKRKLRTEFSQLGRDSVRYNVQIGGYGVAQRRELALEWLREQEDEDDKIKRWTLDAAVIAAAIAVITLLATLGSSTDVPDRSALAVVGRPKGGQRKC
jgi:hypothetical protein